MRNKKTYEPYNAVMSVFKNRDRFFKVHRKEKTLSEGLT